MRKYTPIVTGVIIALAILVYISIQANRSAIINGQIERQVGSVLRSQQVSPSLFEIVFCGTG